MKFVEETAYAVDKNSINPRRRMRCEVDVSMEQRRNTRARKTGDPRENRPPVASPGTILPSRNPGATPPASSLTTTPPRPLGELWSLALGATVTERLDCLPPTMATSVQSPDGSLPEFLQVGIVPGDATGGRVFSRISRFPTHALRLRLVLTSFYLVQCWDTKIRCAQPARSVYPSFSLWLGHEIATALLGRALLSHSTLCVKSVPAD
ncbi:hypothetical protein PR048_000730 [Dryococelus australis]|uniref:Uncharacterized protein n=1 Tax=Dryococelus australis TaxID=614101 RepID=A0ABQ9IFE7_9NEOP|nr:hypothetical protein PR048_000730 [Dryococelus australis]